MNKNIKKSVAFFLSVVMLIVSTVIPMSAFASTPITNSSSSVKMSFATWGDPQVSTFMSERGVSAKASAEDLANAKTQIDALVLAGDLTENAKQKEYDELYSYLSQTKVSNFIVAQGNHDIRFDDYSVSKNKFVTFTNKLNANAGSSLKVNKMNYSYSVKGYKFIVVGSEKKMPEESYISDAQLKWLDSELKASANSGKPVFVVIHQPLKNTHGLPDTWGNNNLMGAAGTVGEQSDSIQKILNKYKNIILITGHLHTGFGKYSYEKIGNIHSVNLPSIGINNQDGYNGPGLGYIAEVFGDKVVFRARDYIKGEYVSSQDITIKLDKVKSVSLSKTSYVYNGKETKPSVTVYDWASKKVASSNYTVSYPKGRKNVGTYKVKVSFKGAYAGTPAVYLSYKIIPKGTKISSLKPTKSKGFTVKWKKQTAQIKGYQIQYSTNSSFKKAKTVTVGKSATSKTISKLSAKKTYYVRIRTYQTVGKTKYYSDWSAKAKVKTNK